MSNECDTTDELMFHFRELASANQESGLSFDDAWDAAEQQFGQLRRYDDECRTLKLRDRLFPGRVMTGTLVAMLLILGWLAWEVHSVGESHGQLLAQTQVANRPVLASQFAAAADGEVLHDLTGQILDPAGKPLANARVLLILKTWPSNRFRQQSFNTMTDEEGRYSFDKLIPEGRKYGVLVTAFKSDSAFASRYILLRNPVGAPEGVDLQLTAATSFPLVVRDANGTPIAASVLPTGRKSKAGDEHLSYFQGSEILKVDTDDQGRVTLDCYAAGDTAEVYIRVGGGEWVRRSFTVPSDGTPVEVKS